jgi:hypothetical protein
VAVLATLAGSSIAAISWLLFLPALVYFGTYFFLRTGRKRLLFTEPLFLVLLGFTLITRYSFLLPPTPFTQLNISGLLLQPDAKYSAVKNARILVLGNDFNYYAYNRATTPYINWQLAQKDFRYLNTYYAVFKIRRNIVASVPDYIVDDAGLMPELMYKIPDLFSRYKQVGSRNIYERRR